MSTNTDDTVKVWDPLVRIFHWSLVFSFFLAYITEDEWESLHVIAGYTVAMLVGFRIIWGLIGTRYARFSQFLKSPSEVLSYVKKMITFNVPHYIGHNPAAAAMIFSLIISLILATFTGMVLIATGGDGPFAGTFLASLDAHWMKEIHEFFVNFTMLLVVFHVAGVVFSSFLENENLVRSMITGRKKNRSVVMDK